MSEFEGKSLFGDRLLAVRGKNGSMILTRLNGDDEDEEGGEDVAISIDADSTAKLAEWIKETQPAGGSS